MQPSRFVSVWDFGVGYKPRPTGLQSLVSFLVTSVIVLVGSLEEPSLMCRGTPIAEVLNGKHSMLRRPRFRPLVAVVGSARPTTDRVVVGDKILRMRSSAVRTRRGALSVRGVVQVAAMPTDNYIRRVPDVFGKQVVGKQIDIHLAA
jgi:hypothetical protein